MITYYELGEMLEEIVNELLEEIKNELPEYLRRDPLRDPIEVLNGGVILLPDTKIHPQSDSLNKLYIMGEYHYQPRGLGRYIAVYYGSFIRVYAHISPERQKEELRRIVRHEFEHHYESLAGDRSLEKKDAQDIMKYKERQNKKSLRRQE